ncbi:hypothetical protein PVAP13_2KG071016 [Panicum virgatum]|uniref:Uncharacterized protein n=1 Tax=Panicum virgatum TaxID=38727 RepID=A0A8T0VYD4_PANVG|nr:hypothetical protein PVAP13_2KG071016 [Panicum virgatum]
MAGPRRVQDLRRRRVTRPSLTCRSAHARTPRRRHHRLHQPTPKATRVNYPLTPRHAPAGPSRRRQGLLAVAFAQPRRVTLVALGERAARDTPALRVSVGRLRPLGISRRQRPRLRSCERAREVAVAVE